MSISPSAVRNSEKIHLPQSIPPILPEKLKTPGSVKLAGFSQENPGSVKLASDVSHEKTKSSSTLGTPVLTNVSTVSTSTVSSPTLSTLSTSTLLSSTLLSKVSVEHELEKLGYKPKDKIFTKKNEQTFARYIKTITDCGHIVYVELDTDGLVSYNTQDYHLDEDETYINIISNDIKRQVCELVLNTVSNISGLIFETQYGILSITTTTEKTRKESAFLYQNIDHMNRNIIPSSTCICYPLIKMSLLQTPNTEILNDLNKGVYDASIRLKNINYIQTQNTLISMIHSIDAFKNVFLKFFKKQESTFGVLNSTIFQLEDFYHQYELLANKDFSRFSKLLYNLNKRYQLLTELHILCQNIGNFGSVLQDEIREISDLNVYLDKEFSGIESILSESK